MVSLIEVRCPHCGTEGKMMTPPLGAIIIGACPECSGMVAVFCGQALALDEAIMRHGSDDEKREHLMEVIGLFVHDRLEQLFASGAGFQLGALEDDDANAGRATPDGATDDDALPEPELSAPPITDEELASFRKVELRLIDDKQYFEAVFGG